MSETDFQNAFQDVAASRLPPPGRQTDELIQQSFRRDTWRMRLFAVASLCCWLAATAGVILLIVGLNRFVIDVRIHHMLPGYPTPVASTKEDPAAPIDDSFVFDATDLLHHSMPFLACSAAAIMLAALFTVLLVFTSRQATMNRISASLARVAEDVRQIRGMDPVENPSAPSELFSLNHASASAAAPSRRAALGIGTLIGVLLLGSIFMVLRHAAEARKLVAWKTYPRLAPFDAIRWRGPVPEARVGGHWYELLSVNDVPVGQIISADTSPGIQWQRKHFGEDLVELMARDGHPAGAEVSLQVRALPDGEIRVLPNVPMTSANRAAVLDADLAAAATPVP